MINKNYIAVFDFETGNIDTINPCPLEIAIKILDPRTLEEVPNGKFESLMRPVNIDKISSQALEKNGIKMEEIEAAPPEELIFAQVAQFLGRFTKGKKPFGSPIACGHNIRGFDLPIIQSLCGRYKMLDGDGRQNLFNMRVIDTMDILFFFMESVPDCDKLSMDFLTEYFGLPKQQHRAMADIDNCILILRRYLTWVRKLSAKTVFKGSFNV